MFLVKIGQNESFQVSHFRDIFAKPPCTFNNSLPLTEMYQTPASAGPPVGYKPPVVEWTFLRRIHWISRFSAPIVVSMVTIVSTKIAHFVIGKENDKIGEIPKLESVL